MLQARYSPLLQRTSYSVKAEDIVELGVGLRGQTKQSFWSIRMEQRGPPNQKEAAGVKPLEEIVEVGDVVMLAMTADELWLVMDIQGWPNKKEPKCFCL